MYGVTQEVPKPAYAYGLKKGDWKLIKYHGTLYGPAVRKPNFLIWLIYPNNTLSPGGIINLTAKLQTNLAQSNAQSTVIINLRELAGSEYG